jgi:hypothetical protein
VVVTITTIVIQNANNTTKAPTKNRGMRVLSGNITLRPAFDPNVAMPYV